MTILCKDCRLEGVERDCSDERTAVVSLCSAHTQARTEELERRVEAFPDKPLDELFTGTEMKIWKLSDPQ